MVSYALQRQYSLKKLYGLTPEDFNRMFAEQEGRCAICKIHQSELKSILYIDHCHETGKIRGLLCPTCNAGVGFLERWYKKYKKEMQDYLGK